MRFGILTAILSVSVLARAEDLQSSVDKTFSEMASITDMKPGETYRVPVGTKIESGTKEAFLWRRTSDEVLASHLSSGCGDYAITFSDLMAKKSFSTLIVDGAEVSTGSLLTHFSGHAVVAVKDPASAHWWLVNSTDRNVLSKDWDTKARWFEAFGRTFWIGYCGPRDKYPIHGAADLQAFYTGTLSSIPPEFLNTHVVKLVFRVSPTLKLANGQFRNPRLARFLNYQSDALAKYHISPTRTATIKLVDGGNSGESSEEKTGQNEWSVKVGSQSGCSPNSLSYIEGYASRAAGG